MVESTSVKGRVELLLIPEVFDGKTTTLCVLRSCCVEQDSNFWLIRFLLADSESDPKE